MFPKCDNTSIIRKEIYSGVIETKGCDCEVVKQQEASYTERWGAWQQRFAELKRGECEQRCSKLSKRKICNISKKGLAVLPAVLYRRKIILD